MVCQVTVAPPCHVTIAPHVLYHSSSPMFVMVAPCCHVTVAPNSLSCLSGHSSSPLCHVTVAPKWFIMSQ